MTSETRTVVEAGMELDALVHTRVFGLPPIPWDHATRCPECGDEMRYCGARSRCSTCNEWRTSPYREYSTEIAAAWLVVERMRELGWYFSLDQTYEGWQATFGRAGVEDEDFWVARRSEREPTAALAICTAALATLAALAPQGSIP